MESGAEAAQLNLIDKGMVHLEVHVLILGEEHQREVVAPGGEAHFHHVGHPPVVPVAHTTLRHHDGAGALAVDKKRADCSLVFSVDRSVAICVAERYGI